MRRCPARTIAEEQDYLAIAGLFRALSNRRSLRIALELRHAEMGISCMASTMRMRPERLFREMLEMVQQRLVRARRRDKRILYSLEFAEIVQVLDLIRAASERRLTKAPADANPLKPRLEVAEFRPDEARGEN